MQNDRTIQGMYTHESIMQYSRFRPIIQETLTNGWCGQFAVKCFWERKYDVGYKKLDFVWRVQKCQMVDWIAENVRNVRKVSCHIPCLMLSTGF